MILSWIFLVDEWMIFLSFIYLEPLFMTRVFVGGTRPCFGVLQAKAIQGIRLVLRTAWHDILEAFNPRRLRLESKDLDC